MNTILDKIIETKQAEVAAAKKARPFAALLEEAQAVSRQPHSFRAALERSDTGIIHKGAQVAEIVPGYAASGATACSILTDTEYFGGSLDDLREARSLTTVPLLRKDFIIDEYQIAEARVAGADVILLIAAALHPEKVNQLCSFAHHLKLEILLEVHKPQELDCICPTIDVVGVNNRNLETFVTDIRTSFELAEQIPTSFVRISESGISSPESVLRLREAGYRGFLMGENFMKEPQPADALRHFIERLKQ